MKRNLVFRLHKKQSTFDLSLFSLTKCPHESGKAIFVSIYPFHSKYNKVILIYNF